MASGPDSSAFDILTLYEGGRYWPVSGWAHYKGSWRIRDAVSLLLGDEAYRFFFSRVGLVLTDKPGKQQELRQEDAEGPGLPSDSLISPFVRRVFQDKSGNLWLGTQGDGVARFDGDTLEYFSVDEGFGGMVVRSIAEDAAGNVWFGTERGVTKYGLSANAGRGSGAGTAMFTNFTERDGLAHNDVWSMAIDREGIIWIGTLQGVSRFDGETFTPFEIPETEPDPYRGVTSPRLAHSIMEDSHGRMWFGTNGGAYVYDARLKGNPGGPLSNISTKDGLPDNHVNDILEDERGNIWFATHYGGVCYWDGASFIQMPTKKRASGTEAWSLYEDRSGNIWFPLESFGVYRFDGGQLTQFHEKEGLSSGAIQCVYEDRAGRVWLGGWMGLFRYNVPQALEEPGGKRFSSVAKSGPWQ